MTSGTHPYTLEVRPNPRMKDHFDWVILKHGELLERSDRPYRTEQEARKSAEKAIERQFGNDQSGR